MGRALANSAASSSFASDVTRDFHVGERPWLRDAKLTELRELEEAEKRRENLPRLRTRLDELRPQNSRAEGQDGPNGHDRARDVERARNDFVHVRLRCGA